MSEDQGSAGDDHTISLERDGIGVEKRLALEEFDTPAVVFTIESDREGAVYVQITDPLPESIDPDDVGLHPEYDSEGWRRRGGDLQFEGRVDPGTTIETVYGLRVAEVERPAALLAEPTIEELVDADVVGESNIGAAPDPDDPGGTDLSDPAEGGMPTPEADGDHEASSDDAEASDGDTEAQTDADGDEQPPADGAEAASNDAEHPGTDDAGEAEEDVEDGADPGTAGSDPEEGVPAGVEEAEPDAPTAHGSVADALAAELEAGDVSEATKATLSDHLEIRLSNSSEIRLDSVQARLSDLEAYTEALEDVIDRLGTDDPLGDLSELREDVEAVHGRLDETEASVQDLADRTDEVAGTAQELEAATEDVREDLQDLRDRLDDLEELPETIDAIEDDVVTLREEVTELREDVEGDLEDIREEVEELQSWRETLAATIAGGGMGGGEE